ncbi:UDP-glucose 4-epimerase family protein [Thioalkalivibrio sulfidiphilus]|uniref:UDP-glucose 4-epimerase family protein n=1 Tax=Thioalkalivibrio sulfidiphilus TaxID=1033854 RepID=UPI003BAF82D6
MKILLTGATGFVGRAVLERLLADRYEVAVWLRQPSDALPAAVTQTTGDLADLAAASLRGGPPDEMCAALRGVDVVVHAAARAHVMREMGDDPLAEYRRVNVDGTLALARLAARAGVRRFVFLSSIKVNGESTLPGRPFRASDASAPEDAYGISKHEAEQALMGLARETGMEFVIIRPPLAYGPGVKGNFASLMRWVAKGVPLPFGAVRQNRRSLVGLGNLVDLIVTCLDHPAAANQVFLAGDGEDLSTAELLERVGRAMNRRARLFPVPVWMLQSAAAMAGKREVARRLCGSLQVDISKARDVLGWTPPVSVDEGLRRSVAPLVR